MNKRNLAVTLCSLLAVTELLAFAPPVKAAPICRRVYGNEAFTVCREGNKTVWTIQAPNVNQPYVIVPNVKVRQGDRVVVDAGGCVQTGGSGKTWKRYVNPIPGNQYYGTVQIPGATNGNVPISSIIGQTLTVGAINGYQAIGIGYVDDSYGDNGYNDRNSDNGTHNQCRGLGSAYIVVTILR